MFTGIITDIGCITQIAPAEGGYHLRIACHYDMESVAIGASIACNGICLTVTAKQADCFDVHASSETARITTLGSWKTGQHINLERALRLGDELGGHLVQGHVDGIGTINSITPDGASHIVRIVMPESIAPLVARKGSVAVDGISLTVNEVSDHHFSLMIIPHSWDNTHLKFCKAGDAVNLEADLLARYLQRHLSLQVA